MENKLLRQVVEEYSAEGATGCPGAGDYRVWAKERGYEFCEVLDWTSSAGDWSFIVSVDGETWYIMYQTNNWPHRGFTRRVDTEKPFFGTAEEILGSIHEPE